MSRLESIFDNMTDEEFEEILDECGFKYEKVEKGQGGLFIGGRRILYDELHNITKLNSLWCSRNNCTHYNKDEDKCTRIGKYADNKDKVGICWMNISEGDY